MHLCDTGVPRNVATMDFSPPPSHEFGDVYKPYMVTSIGKWFMGSLSVNESA